MYASKSEESSEITSVLSSSPSPKSDGLRILESEVRYQNNACILSLTPSEVMLTSGDEVLTSFLSTSILSVKLYQAFETVLSDQVSDVPIPPYHPSEQKSARIDNQKLQKMVDANDVKRKEDKEKNVSIVPASRSRFEFSSIGKQLGDAKTSMSMADQHGIDSTFLVICYLLGNSLDELILEVSGEDMEPFKNAILNWCDFKDSEDSGNTRIIDGWRCNQLWQLIRQTALQESSILTSLMALQMENMLSAQSFAKNLRKVYSTDSHGFQIVQFYDAMEQLIHSKPVTVIIIKNGVDEIFGLVFEGLVHPISPIPESQKSFDFKFIDGKIEHSWWENSQSSFVVCGESSISFGVTESSSGIVLEGSLRTGKIGNDEFDVSAMEVFVMND